MTGLFRVQEPSVSAPLLAAAFTIGNVVGAAGLVAALFWAFDDDPAADHQRWLVAKEPRR